MPPTTGADPAILGLDNVRLELPLAGLGSRTLAASLDHFLAFLLQAVWLTAGLATLPQLGIAGGWVAGFLTLGFFLLQWGYFTTFEIVNGGQTPGKMAVGLRVVSQHGGRTTPAAVLIRNFIRTFDILVGVPIMAIDRRSRRIGDMVGGTLVVHHRNERGSRVRLGRHPDTWGAREVAVAENFLRRAELLDPETAERLAERLLHWISASAPVFWAEASEGTPAATDPVDRLRRVLEVEG